MKNKYKVHAPKVIKTFKGGGIRSDDSNKPSPSLISPFGLMRLGDLYAKGGKIYSPYSWERGIPFRRCLDSLLRHAIKYMGGAKDEDHLAAIAWNAFAIIHQEELIRRKLLDPKFDDLRVYKNKKGKQLIPRNIFLPGEFDETKKKKGNKNRRVLESKVSKQKRTKKGI